MMYGNDDEAEIVKAGYLTKSPPGAAPPMSQWRRRWFVLRDSSRVYPLAQRHIRLEYYQSETDAKKLFDPKGAFDYTTFYYPYLNRALAPKISVFNFYTKKGFSVIDLKNCSRVSNVAKLKGHSYVFDICTKERTYHIAAETPTDKYDWMKTLNELLFQEVKEVQDLEKAEIQRKKSVVKPPAERQRSWGDLLSGTDKRRPTSCFITAQDSKFQEDAINYSRKPQQQQGGNKKRPLPPTPDIPTGSVTLQSSGTSSPHQHHSSSSIATDSPPPPLPKPRSKTSTESIPPAPSSPSPTSVTASLPADLVMQQTPSIQPHSYENVPQRIDQPPPPVPRPRHKTSLDDNPGSHSSYENLPRHPQTSVPDYEDIDLDDNTSSNGTPLLDNISSNNTNRTTSVNKIIFLDPDIYEAPDQDVYADVDQDDVYTDPDVEVESGNSYLYEDNSASNYEVPVTLKSPPPIVSRSGPRLVPSPGPPAPSPRPPQHQSSINSNNNSSLTDNPPIPPPRTKIIKKRSSIHSSLINLADDGLYSELHETEREPSDDEHYGKLIRCVARERRFSDPEVIPISPRSHSGSPLFFSHKPKNSPPPVPPPYTGGRSYYENTSTYNGGAIRSQLNGYT